MLRREKILLLMRYYAFREQNSFYGVDFSPLYKDAVNEMFGKYN